MKVAIYVIFALIFLGAATMLGLSLKDYVTKEEDHTKLFKGKHLLILGSVIGGALSLMALFLPFALLTLNLKFSLMIVGGSFLFGLSLLTFAATFVIHYYKLNVIKVNQKLSKLVLIISGVLIIPFLFLLLDGLTYAGALTFPLPKGIPFENPVVAFYAIFILAGALLVWLIADHEFYKKYGQHGRLENVFYVAFPAGIVGARLWYVIGNWKVDGFDQDFMKIFQIRDGGLAIMGGALLGAFVGVLFFLKYRKEYDPRFAADMIIPAILIAQAIGRWGNFFNQEVYGNIANINNWMFLPAFVRENMMIGGNFVIPLFYIEAIVNLLGYFVIRFGVGEGLKKYKKPLDQAFMYLVWYGLTRFVMEPMRNPDFNMGTGGNWSYVWSAVFIASGVILIAGNHVIHYLHSKKQQEVVANGGHDEKRKD